LNFGIGDVMGVATFTLPGKRLVGRHQGRARNERRKEKAETVLRRKVEESRDRNRPLQVFVSARADIETRAGATGLSVSAYLRNLGLGFQPHSTLDYEAILTLLKVNADEGRLGGLFKLWLSGQSEWSAETMEIRCLLVDIEERQRELKALIGRLAAS
jgi:hypothetical protein